MARQPTANTQEASASRPKRTPLAQRNRLSVKNQEPGYVYRIVNDIDDRIALLQENGWELVPNAKVGVIGDRKVDNAAPLGSITHISVGNNTKAVVMRIPDAYYKEDQEAKEAQLKEVELLMRQEAKKNADFGDLLVSR